MKLTASIMSMPVTVDIVDKADKKYIEDVFIYLKKIDELFSTYKETSEISKINRGELKIEKASEEVRKVLSLCEQTKKETNGYFDIKRNGKIDPSGIVKGYAIFESANILAGKGYENFYVEIAGDIEVRGLNHDRKKWRVGIENPFDQKEIIKVLLLSNKGIATSGNYIRGKHIYNPISQKQADDIALISVIGPNAYEADRFATAAFAMGEKGLEFINNLKGFEGYMVTKDKKAYYTEGFGKYVY